MWTLILLYKHARDCDVRTELASTILTDFHKRMVRSIAGLKETHGSSSKSGTLPKFKIIQVKSLFGDSDDDGVDEWPQVRGVRAYYSSVLFECKAREFFHCITL